MTIVRKARASAGLQPTADPATEAEWHGLFGPRRAPFRPGKVLGAGIDERASYRPRPRIELPRPHLLVGLVGGGLAPFGFFCRIRLCARPSLGFGHVCLAFVELLRGTGVVLFAKASTGLYHRCVGVAPVAAADRMRNRSHETWRKTRFLSGSSAAMCPGERPQQPPTICTPSSTHPVANRRNSSGGITSSNCHWGILK